MPTLRLEEVIKDIIPALDQQPQNIQNTVKALRLKGQTFDHLDADTAAHLRAIAEALNISLFDLFVPAEKLYRLRIIEIIEEKYSGTFKKKLEALYADLLKSIKISFPLLGIYATQILPDSLLKGIELQYICELLDVNLEKLKELSEPPKQTICVESVLKELGITLDELEILFQIPKKFLPWISTEPQKRITNNSISFQKIEEKSPCCELRILYCCRRR